MDSPYLGMMIMFGGNFQIRGWAFCNGQLMSISQNSALFSLLGTTYGGDGRTTFALPNLQGRVPIGMGSGAGLSAYTEGQMGGTENVTLVSSQLPAHTHTANVVGTSTAASMGNPSGAFLAAQPRSGGVSLFATGNADTPMAPGSVHVDPVGNSSPVSIMQPYLVVNYLIALQGIYPPRD